MTITLTRKEAQQVLDAFEAYQYNGSVQLFDEAIETLRARLAQPEAEPVAQYSDIISDGGLDPRNKFDTALPQRELEKVAQAMRLYEAVERLALQAGEEPDETIDWLCGEHSGMFKLFESYFSPQREWHGLTDEDVEHVLATADRNSGQYKRTPGWAHLITATEAKLKEKNK